MQIQLTHSNTAERMRDWQRRSPAVVDEVGTRSSRGFSSQRSTLFRWFPLAVLSTTYRRSTGARIFIAH